MNPPARRIAVFFGVALAVGVYVASSFGSSRIPPRREAHPQTAWAPCNRNARNRNPSTFSPMSDAAAAVLVSPQRETRSYNSRPYTLAGKRYPPVNDYVPLAKQIAGFRRTRTSLGERILHFNPYFRYVDGHDGMPHPSTDELIQWAAHKWGIPENWLRAEYVLESWWNQFQLGDESAVSSTWYSLYPPEARVPGTRSVLKSLGITQVQWKPDGSVGVGSEPLRWQSTAFNVDYQAAVVRFYYDNPSGARSAWGDSSYVPCQAWESIGGWYRPFPWRNADQARYISQVRGHLADRTWTISSFVDWSPSSLPPAIKFR